MYFESFDRTKIWYQCTRRNNPFVVFLHGWGNNWTTWKKEREFFEEKGYSTLVLDLRGHGLSDKPEQKSSYSIECFAKDLYELLKKENITNFILAGHSMGGMVALKYYDLFQEELPLRGLVLCDTTAQNILEHKPIKQLSPFVHHVLEFLIAHKDINKRYFCELENVDLTTFRDASDYYIFYKGLYNTPLKSVFACLHAMLHYDVSSVLEIITVPTLIIHGSEDDILSSKSSQFLQNKISGASLHIIPGARHAITLAHAELVDKFMIDFLEKNGLDK